MGVVADDSVDRMQQAGLWGDEPNEVVEPAEFDCPACGGPAHCRTECDRRFAVRQRDIDAWHEVWKQVRFYVPADKRGNGDALMEPF